MSGDTSNEEEWSQVPIQAVDLDHEHGANWIIGLEFLREEGADKARVRSVAMNEETGEEFRIEAPSSNGTDDFITSHDDLFEILPEDVAMVLESMASTAAISNLIGMGREAEALIESDSPELADGHYFELGDFTQTTEIEPALELNDPDRHDQEPMTEAEVEAAIADANLDEELTELDDEEAKKIMTDRLWDEAAELSHGEDQAAVEAALERLIAYQEAASAEVSRRDYGSENPEGLQGFAGKEQERRDRGDEQGQGLGG